MACPVSNVVQWQLHNVTKDLRSAGRLEAEGPEGVDVLHDYGWTIAIQRKRCLAALQRLRPSRHRRRTKSGRGPRGAESPGRQYRPRLRPAPAIATEKIRHQNRDHDDRSRDVKHKKYVAAGRSYPRQCPQDLGGLRTRRQIRLPAEK